MLRETIKKLLGPRITIFVVHTRWKIYNCISCLFPMQKEILLESYPDFTCNTYELYRLMIQEGINKDFRLTWLVDESTELKEVPENVGFLNMYPKGFVQRLKFHIHCNRARVLITANRHLPKAMGAKKQLNFFLDHGSQLKSLLKEGGKRRKIDCDYMICQSDFFVPYNVDQYTVTEDQIICTGLPRNDQLFRKYDSIRRIVPDHERYKKIIIWVPTFRDHMSKTRIDCNHHYPLGLPVLNSKEDAGLLNDVLKSENVLLIIKPHPAQNLDVIKSVDLSNIRYIYNADLAENDIQTNELLAQTDAMITDYSSIYYDYLLLDRPIAITLDDYDDYTHDKGFVFDDPLDVLKGAYLYNLHDFCEFVRDLAHGVDSARMEREKICKQLHTFNDSESSRRVLEFILKKEKERFGD